MAPVGRYFVEEIMVVAQESEGKNKKLTNRQIILEVIDVIMHSYYCLKLIINALIMSS